MRVETSAIHAAIRGNRFRKSLTVALFIARQRCITRPGMSTSESQRSGLTCQGTVLTWPRECAEFLPWSRPFETGAGDTLHLDVAVEDPKLLREQSQLGSAVRWLR